MVEDSPGRLTEETVKTSKHFCILPWVHAIVHMDGQVMNCCREGELGYSYGSLKNQSIEEIWNGSKVREMREALLRDVALPQCQICYHEESNGILSDRQRMLGLFSSDVSAVLNRLKNGVAPLDHLKFLGVRASNLCNLRCRTCSPGLSTSWYSDAKVITGSVHSGVRKAFVNGTDLSQFLKKTVSSLEVLYFAGGEPFLQTEHVEVLENLISAGRTDVELRYNTNLSLLPDRTLRLLSHFKTIRFDASLDGVGEHNDLLRKGSHWETIVRNFKKIRESLPHARFSVSPVWSVLNAHHLPAAIRGWSEQGMLDQPESLVLNILKSPDYYSVLILNAEERSRLILQYQIFLNEFNLPERTELGRMLAKQLSGLERFLLSGPFMTSERVLFRQVTFQMDKLRKERVVQLFPELFEILYEN